MQKCRTLKLKKTCINELSNNMGGPMQKSRTSKLKETCINGLHDNMEVSIAWKTSPISHMKTAATKHSSLCMKERAILFNEYGRNATPDSPKLLNSRDELHGGCK